MTKRALISFVLILTYSVGFAHNFIPHCTDAHTDENHSEVEHHHAHHTHDGHNSNEEDHSHVKHEDHFDEGLLDYLICLIEGAQHHDHSCDAQCPSQNSAFKYSTKKSMHGDQLITAELSIPFVEKRSGIINTNIELDLTQFDPNSSPGRAPPYTYL